MQVSLFDALSEWVLPAAYYALYGGSAPSRCGAEHASIAPYGPYFTGDGKQINIGIQNEREWGQFCALVLLNREIAADPRFYSNSQRSENRKALRSVIAEIFRTLTLEEIVERLEHAGIAHSRANSVQELLPHPQHAARGRWRNVASPVGPLQALLPSILLDGADPRMEAIPALGQDTDAILTELGHHPEFIGRGEDAADRVAQGAFDAVLMDMVLPGIDGIAAIGQIRALETPPRRVPIIGISGRGDDEAAARAAGADAFLVKPVSPRALATALLEATRRAAAAT